MQSVYPHHAMRDASLSRPSDSTRAAEGEIPRHLQHQTLAFNLS
jgi:hypothetical protein